MARNQTKPDRTRQISGSSRTLTPAQLAAVDLVVTGKSDGDVAEAVGVTRQTVSGWRHYHPEFRAAVNTRRREVFGQAADRLRSLLGRALDVLAEELDATQWSEERLKVALKLLDYGAPLLTAQVVQLGPEDADELLEAEAGRRHGDDVHRLLAGGGPGAGAALRREWAEKLAAVEATDGHEGTTEGGAGAG
jgi:hypothetical protein